MGPGKDIELNRMAGNSISVPVIGCLLAVVLASCDFGGTTDTGSGSKSAALRWIGPNRIPGTTTSVDTLYVKDEDESQGRSRKRPAAMRKPSSKLKQTKLDDVFCK